MVLDVGLRNTVLCHTSYNNNNYHKAVSENFLLSTNQITLNLCTLIFLFLAGVQLGSYGPTWVNFDPRISKILGEISDKWPGQSLQL